MAEQRSETIGRSATRVETSSADPESINPDEAAQALREWTQANPHAALAGAAAIGFLIGGGLTPKMIGAIGMVAARYYLKNTARDLLDSLVPEELAAVIGKRHE